MLPEGVYDCTAEEARDMFGSGNPHAIRAKLWDGLEQFMQWVSPWHIFSAIYIDGSFVTAKAVPSDIDIVIELPDPTHPDLNLIPPEFLDQIHIRRTYGLDMYLFYPSVVHDLRAFFQYIKARDIISLGLNANDRKGILRITL
jgi:hypothetical protein